MMDHPEELKTTQRVLSKDPKRWSSGRECKISASFLLVLPPPPLRRVFLKTLSQCYSSQGQNRLSNKHEFKRKEEPNWDLDVVPIFFLTQEVETIEVMGNQPITSPWRRQTMFSSQDRSEANCGTVSRGKLGLRSSTQQGKFSEMGSLLNKTDYWGSVRTYFNTSNSQAYGVLYHQLLKISRTFNFLRISQLYNFLTSTGSSAHPCRPNELILSCFLDALIFPSPDLVRVFSSKS